MYKVIDSQSDPRRDQIENFRKMADPYASITAMVEVTSLISARGTKHFFQTFLFVVTNAVNTIPELRRRFLFDKIVEYDYTPPSYTLMGDDGVYRYCTLLEKKDNVEDFVQYCLTQGTIAKKRHGLVEEGETLGHIFISCIPWISYTSLKTPLPNKNESHVMVEWGKYERQSDSRIFMPLTIGVNHALADGIHMAKFYENVDKEIIKICNQ